jgi:hypothetical protein
LPAAGDVLTALQDYLPITQGSTYYVRNSGTLGGIQVVIVSQDAGDEVKVVVPLRVFAR